MDNEMQYLETAARIEEVIREAPPEEQEAGWAIVSKAMLVCLGTLLIPSCVPVTMEALDSIARTNKEIILAEMKEKQERGELT